MSASPAPELSVVLDGYERFKRGIQRTSQEAILKRLPSHYTFILSGLQVNILRIRKKAWQRDKNDLNKPSRPSANLSECSGDEDGVFEPIVRMMNFLIIWMMICISVTRPLTMRMS